MKLVPLNRFKKQLTKKTPAKLVKYLNSASMIANKKYEEAILKELDSRDIKVDWSTQGFGRWILSN